VTTLRMPSVPSYERNAKRLFAATAIGATGFLGVYHLERVLYLLRLGHGPEYIGIFVAAGAWVYSGMGVPSGALGTRFGARRTMLLGVVIAVSGLLTLTLSETVPASLQHVWPIVSHMLTVVGWSMLNVNIVPALMSATTAENRHSAYALLSALRGTGAFLGSLVGGWLPGLMAPLVGQGLDAPGPYRASLWVGAAILLLSLLPVLTLRIEQPAPSQDRAAPTGREGRFPYALVLPFALYIGLSHGGWSVSNAFLNAYMDQDLRLSPAAIGQLTSLGQFIAIAVPLAMPRLMRLRSPGWVLVVATLGVAASFLPIALVPHWTAASLGRVGIIAFTAIRLPAIQVFMMELVDEQWRSLAYGVGSMAQSLGSGLMCMAGGFIILALGYSSIFYIGAGICGLSAVWLLFVLRQQTARAQ